jgi:ABC-2 type transport system permease protein
MRGPSREFRVIFHEEFRRQIRRRGFIFFTLLIPILMGIAILVTPFIVNLIESDSPDDPGAGDAAPLESAGYTDPAGVLPGPGLQDAPIQYSDLSEGIQALQQGEIDTFFALPADYLESGEVEQYQASGDSDGGLTGRIWGSEVEWAFSDFLRHELASGQVEDDVLARVLWPADYQNFEIGDDGTITEAIPLAQDIGELMVPLLFGVLLIIAVLTGSGTLSSSVAEEKETRMVEMLVTSASPLSIMSAKLLALGFAGLIQIAVWITVAAFAIPAIFDRIPNGGELTISLGLLALVVVTFVLGYFLYSALALLLATLTPSIADAQKATGLLTLLIFVPVWMIGLFMSQPDGTIAQIFTYFPFTAPTMLMIRLGMGSVSGGEIAAALGIVAATALLLLWVAARVFRAGILLSGQRITPGNVWTALRHAD